MRFIHWFIALFAFTYPLVSPPSAVAQVEVPPLTARVVDQAEIFTPEERYRLSEQLAGIESEQGAQIAILTINSSAPETIEAFSHRVASAWALGRDGVDDGILITIAKEERAARIEVGYGLEGAIPDVTAKRLLENYTIPSFREGSYYDGLVITLHWLAKLIRGEQLPQPPLQPDYTFLLPLLIAASSLGQMLDRAIGKLGAIVVGTSAAFLIAYFLSNIAAALIISFLVAFFIAIGGMPGSAGRHQGSIRIGGHRSSGGGGGFSGGGGSFGGGGASGRW